MKKLALIVIIVALSMAPAVTLADSNGWKRFHGTYEMVASGSCSHSGSGWTGFNGQDNLLATPPLKLKLPITWHYVGTTVTYGTWIFNKDGTGEYTITNYATILPGGNYNNTDAYLKTQNPPTTQFTFVVNPFGDIEVTAAGIKITGNISIDKKMMVLSNGNQVQDFTGIGLGWTVCNSARTLIKVGD
jgi:hypothetical protein